MKIAFDGQIFNRTELTGIGWLGYHTLSALDGKNRDIREINLYCPKVGTSGKVKELEQNGYRRRAAEISHLMFQLLGLSYADVFQRDADVTVFFNYVIPKGVYGKTITYIHDMSYKACPGNVRWQTAFNLKLNMRKTLRRADRIITLSSFSREEISRFFPSVKEKISVLPCGVDRGIFHPGFKEADIAPVLKKYGITGAYFLYMGTIEPRKNIRRMLYAYRKALGEMPQLPQVVLAGGSGWKNRPIYGAVKKLGIEGKVKFIGYVGDEERPALLNGATAFVYPSLYEGFGMPPLEAMACGTPVVTSDASSLPEVVGDAALLIDPQSVDEIAKAMLLIAGDGALRENLKMKGLERAECFTWEKTAEKLRKLIEEVAKEPENGGNREESGCLR